VSAKIAIICDPDKFSAKLQAFGRRLFGRPVHPDLPYHCAWVTENAMYDMNWRFRKIDKDHYDKRVVHVFDAPVEVSEAYLESMVGKRYYGVLDVLLYPLYQLFGFNAYGTHCSEAINDDCWFHGYRTPWIPYGAAPDPNDIILWLESR
jgi:hypothetical protein